MSEGFQSSDRSPEAAPQVLEPPNAGAEAAPDAEAAESASRYTAKAPPLL